jgi:hypothetical protein
MDQNLMVNLVVEKDGQKFTFSMPYGCKLGAAYDAGFEVLKELVELSKQAVKNADPVAMNPQQLQEAVNQAN